MPKFPMPTLDLLGQLYERHQTRIVTTTTLVLLIAAAWQTAGLVWSLIPLPESARWQPPPVAAAPRAESSPAALLNGILESRLFGQYSAVGNAEIASAPETRLNLKLIGILAGTRTADSRAIIARQDAPEAAYAIGDDIANGVSLHAIFADRVVLSRNGQLETLRLDPTQSGAPAPQFRSAPTQMTGALPQQLALARQEMLQDPNKTADYIRIQPNNTGGRLNGYRVYPGRNADLFNNAGLRPGDLVTAVNGVLLDDNQKGLQMLNDLSKAGSVSLTIDRGGQPQTLNMSFN